MALYSDAQIKYWSSEMAADFPFSIIFQSSELVVVDKPTGLSVHNDAGKDLVSILSQGLKQDVYPVHRLDKETSGVQLLALSSEAASEYAEAFQAKTNVNQAPQFQSRSGVQKIYFGVVCGSVKEDRGIWMSPLTDKAEGRDNPSGNLEDQVPCETHYQVLRRNPYFSLCEFDLITGRQHQIRKHCLLARHALAGDPRYGNPKYNAKLRKYYGLDRMYLHCYSLQIGSQKFEAQLPEDFKKLFN